MSTWLLFPFSCGQNEGLFLQSLLRETFRAPGSKQKPFLRAHKCVSLAQDRPPKASTLRLVNTEPPGIHQPLFNFSYLGPISHGTCGSWVPTLSSFQSLSHVWLCNPMNCSMPGLPVHHQFLEFTQTHVHRAGSAIQLSHPLSSPFPPALNPSQHQSLFQWANSLHEVAKVLEFQLQHQSLQRTPWTDLF